MSDAETVDKLANQIAAEPSTADSSWVPSKEASLYCDDLMSQHVAAIQHKALLSFLDQQLKPRGYIRRHNGRMVIGE